MARTRIGTVGYLNAAPLTQAIDRERYEVVADHPRGISAQLVSGEVAAGLVPVAAVLSDGDFRIVPGWCIGADGAVHSVVLTAEVPPEQWTRVVLDGESRTSVVLAQLLLKQGPLADRVGEIEIETVEPGAGVELARGTTAAVVIGDAARVLPERLTVRLDLAELWKEWTGKPFVFAVWAGRAGLSPEVCAELRRAGEAGVAAVRDAYDGEDLTYLSEHIRYPLDEPALVGLRRFASMAYRAGLVQSEHVAFVSPPRQARFLRDELDTSLADAADGVVPSKEIAKAWLTELRDGDLHVAAHHRRREIFGSEHATYLLSHRLPVDGWREALVEAAVANAVAVEVPGVALETALDEVGKAGLTVLGADLAALDPHEIEVLSRKGLQGLQWTVGEPIEALAQRLQAAADASVAVEAVIDLSRHDDLVDAIWQVRDVVHTMGVHSVRLTTALPVGSLVEPGRATTARWLRAIALARLLLPEVDHVSADPGALGADACQAALFVGADDYGVVGVGVAPREGAERFEVGLEEAERLLRVAGLSATRRALTFGALGGPLTRLRKIRRPEERARL